MADMIKIDRARVTKDGPELKTSSAGNEYVRFTVMWSSSRKDRSDQWDHGPTKFLKVTCFGELAQQVMQTVRPETNVSLYGKVEHFEWQSQNGPRDDWSMLADMVSPARSNGKQQGGAQQQRQGGFSQRQGDPWNAQPQGGFGGDQDEPPFS